MNMVWKIKIVDLAKESCKPEGTMWIVEYAKNLLYVIPHDIVWSLLSQQG